MNGLGLLLSLVQFLRSEVGGRTAKEEILKALDNDRVIQQYLEWLRRQDLNQLVQQIETSKLDLLNVVSDLSDEFGRVSDRIVASARDVATRIESLNEQISIPVLSPVAIPTRYGANITLRGREQELARLYSDKDTLVFGQPGSGKTSLLQTFAALTGAQFILSDNADAVIGRIMFQQPKIVIIDDGGPRQELIRRLQHTRAESGIIFRIIAVCWPFEKIEMQQILQLADGDTLELQGLPRKIIAEVIREIAEKRNVSVNDQFIRVVAKQARGKPGLAASLTLATIESSGEALFSGELLLKDLEGFLRRHIGEESIDVLAAFACGGETGIATAEVAKHIGKPIIEIVAITRRIALAGVLQEVEKDVLAVQPDFLRSALLKTSFFPESGPALPFNLCNALIESSKQPVSGYVELIHAKGRAAASISDNVLREQATSLDNDHVWGALAWIDEDNCRWVVEHKKHLTADIKRAALHYAPNQIIPIMLDGAAKDGRPLHAFPQADLRILEDWAAGGEGVDAIKRREILFGSEIQWLTAGGDKRTAFTALSFVFNLKCHVSDSDPADPNTIRWRDWLVSLDDAKKISALWEELVETLNKLIAVPWGQIVHIVDNWLHSDRPRGSALPKEYVRFLEESSSKMIRDVANLAKDNQAVMRWAYLRGKSLGLNLTSLPLSADFMVLYPEERLSGDFEEIQRQQIDAAKQLARAWQSKPFSEIVQILADWQVQVQSFGRVWPRMSSVFCEQLAELYSLNHQELSLAIAKLDAEDLTPFLEAALSAGSINEEHLEECLARNDLEGVLINFVLLGKLPQLYERLQPRFPPWRALIEARCLRAEVSDEVLAQLLAHSDPAVKFETALGMFRGRDRKPIPTKLVALWEEAIVQGLALLPTGEIDHPPYDLEAIILFNRDIRTKTLERILVSNHDFHGFQLDGLLNQLVAPLSKGERHASLKKCKNLSYSVLPGMLVGRDAELYQQLLDMPELKRFHLDPLCGDPNENGWDALAKLALAAGYEPKTLSHSVDSRGFSWTGHLSTYYQQWVQSFTQLSAHADSEIQQIAAEGLKWARAARDLERRRERIESIEGWD
jgi:hypothetical protein